MSKSSTRKSSLLFLPNIFHYDFSEVAYTDVTTDARVLFDAVRHGKTHLVRFILEASAIDVVNARDLHGKTPLMTCCYTKVCATYPFDYMAATYFFFRKYGLTIHASCLL